jgi:hypothetical protein
MDILKDASTIAEILSQYHDSPLGKEINIDMSAKDYDKMHKTMMDNMGHICVFSIENVDENIKSFQIYGIKFNFKIV